MRRFLLGVCLLWAPAHADDAAELNALFKREAEIHYGFHPLAATADGIPGHDDRLDDVSPAARKSEIEALKNLRTALSGIGRSNLNEDGKLNYDLFRYDLDDRMEGLSLDLDRLPMDGDAGFFAYLPDMGRGVRMISVKNYEDYIARLAAIPGWFDANIANARRGMADGFTLPAAVMPALIESARKGVPENARESGYFAPFLNMPASIPEAERKRLGERALAVIGGPIRNAYAGLTRFLEVEYAPHAKPGLAAGNWPDGQRIYAYLARHHTTLSLTPEEIHETGLREVARIHEAMTVTMREAGWTGNFGSFLEFLRTDPRFYAKTPDELLRYAAWLAKRVDIQLPKLFGLLPRQPYGVEPVPAAIAPHYTTARYVGAPIGGDRGGAYWVNTHDLPSRPLYEFPALTLHEAVPGHHLQIALSQELEGVPAFRRRLAPTAFVEGWALYSESLGNELGLYTTPYERFGRLSYEMWRALRLVVDTGIHAKGWSREKAIAYMAENSALSLGNIENEVDRYIAWPGQALGYKMGELAIQRLRAEAESALGGRFDERAFHDRVLSAGGLPLAVLETRVRMWIEARKSANP